jgi:hypothetical protein
MSIIKPNLPLINKVQFKLNEIATISLAKVFDKDAVLDKIKFLIKDLTELNVVQKDVLQEYRQKNKELFNHMEQQMTEISQLAETAEKYADWSQKYLDFVRNNVEMTDKFLEEGKKYENIIEQDAQNPTHMNHALIREVLSTYLQIKLTRKRRRSIWWNYQIFRLNIFYRTMLNVVISTLIGYSVETIMSFFFPEIPDFVVTIGIAFLIFFTLEKYLGKKFSTFFWNLIQKQSLVLYLELKLYLQQIKLGN